MFKVSSNAHALTGDGPSVAYRRGIPLEDMEFFQFHPTGLYKLGILLIGGRARRGRDRAEQGRRAVHGTLRADDQGPRPARRRLPRDLPGDQGGPWRRAAGDIVYLDFRHLDPKVIEEKLPDITEFARVYLRVEPTTEPVPIQPTAHYAMGGIPTDVDGQVVVGRRRDAGPRSLRGRGMRLRERPRRQPPGDELAPGHRGVRSSRRRPHGGVTPRRSACRGSPASRCDRRSIC